MYNTAKYSKSMPDPVEIRTWNSIDVLVCGHVLACH